VGPPLSGHGAAVPRLEFSPDGRRLATGGADGLVAVWDIASGERQFRLKGHIGAITSLAFTPDGMTLASGSADGTAKLWALGTPEKSKFLEGVQTRVYSVAYSPNGQWLAAGDLEGAKLWDARTGRLVWQEREHQVARVAFSPDSRTLATGDGQFAGEVGRKGKAFLVQLWDVASGTKLDEFQGPTHDDSPRRTVGSLAFSPDGTKLAAGFGRPGVGPSNYEQVIKVWDPRTGLEVKTLPVPNTVPSIAFSPDGTTLAAACHDGTLRVWAVATWREVLALPGSDPLHCIAFSPDGRTLATGIRKALADVCLLDAATGRQKMALKGHTDAITAAAFSPDGSTLASSSLDKTVQLWDLASGRLLRTLRGHTDTIKEAVFSPDGNTLVTGGSDNSVRLWAAASPQAVANALTQDRALEIRRAAFDHEHSDRAGQRPQRFESDWFLRDWLILAPIALAEGQTGADGVDQEQLAGEANLRPKEGDKALTIAGQELVWRKRRIGGWQFPFNGILRRQTERSVGYAVCYVESDADRTDLELQVGSDDQAKVYLNSREVYKYRGPGASIPDRDAVKVSLRRGTNVVVLKVVNETGAWQNCLRFADAQGRPVPGLRVSLTPER
jgi:WD40 repeat protein